MPPQSVPRRCKHATLSKRCTMELMRCAHYKTRTVAGWARRLEFEGEPMAVADAVPKVLEQVDRDLQSSLDRLFALLRIQSVSTAPAYAPQCRKAAEFVAADLKTLGFAASVRPTAGHPVVIGKSSEKSGERSGEKSGDGSANGKAPRVLF